MASHRPNAIRRIVSTLFGGAESEAAHVSPINPRHSTPVSPETFRATLDRLIDTDAPGTFKAGCINVIGLDRVKARLGDDWPRLAERAKRIARNSIARHLLPGDMFSVLPNDSFIIMFGHLTELQAQTKARFIAKEIANGLLGDEGEEAIEVKTALHDGGKGLTFAEVPSLEVLAHAAIETQVALHAPASREAATDHRDEKPIEVETAFERATKQATAPDIPPPSWTKLAKPAFVYRPIWDTRHNVISGYRCSAIGSGIEQNDEDSFAKMDFSALAHVQEDLRELKRDGRRLLISLPIHFDTLSQTKRRHTYIGALRSGLPEGTSSLLVLELVRVPDGVPKSRLVELTAPLQLLCRAVVARLPLETSDFSTFAAARIPLVGCHIGRQSGPEFNTMKLLNRFSKGAHKAGLIIFVAGSSSLSMVAAAVGAGFRFIDGECVAKSVAKPGAVLSFELSDIYRGL